ncbi:MAG TPA: hypothetical protein ENH94_09670 [Phycisphaerales bacterium]|nr:hypothetical protein [Phycisphaerales bacterium]
MGIEKELSVNLTEKEYVINLLALRKEILPVLSNNILPHFTDHSVSHSDRLVTIINELLSPIPNSKKLSGQELLILFASCYLHDIGMQYENAGETRTIKELHLEQEWNELAEKTRRDYLRDQHHKISADFVIMLSPNGNSPINYKLPNEMRPDYIAALCEAHGISVEELRYQELLESIPAIRMPLLSAILRLADILDESSRRICLQKFKTLLPDIKSKTHWWRHYYTEDIAFDNNKKKISLIFDFPTERIYEYEKIVPQLQLPWIYLEFNKHNAILNELQMNWSVTSEVKHKPYTTAECMPEEVLSEMLKELHFRKSKEAEEKQLMVLNSFTEARPYIQKRINALKGKKEKLDTNTYLLELWDIAKYMKEIGSKRSSWNILMSDFNSMQSLPKRTQIEIGIWLADTILEDGFAHRAVDVINRISGLANEIEDVEVLIKVLKIKLKVLISAFHWDEAKKTFLLLFLKTTDSDKKENLLAEMSEWCFLNGEFVDVSVLPCDVEGSQC